MQISTNFALSEFEESQTADNTGIDNAVPRRYIGSIIKLTTYVLQPARDALGALRITSGYRCPELNQAVGGEDGSQHMRGEAADLSRGSIEKNTELFEWIRDTLKYDQLILENGGAWVHVSYSENNRQVAWEQDA